MDKDGIVYMAFGDRSRKAAEKSYESIKRIHGLIPAVLIGNEPSPYLGFIPWRGDSPWEESEPTGQRFYAGRVKPFLYDYSPFENTLYLDADTMVCKPILPGFEMLEENDVLIADDPRWMENTFKKSKQGKQWDWIREQRDFTHDFIGKDRNKQINTGVIFFRKNTSVEGFFSVWAREWLRYPKWDEQMAFMRAESLCEFVKFKHLPTIWNTNNADLKDKIIYHMWGQQKARDLLKEKENE